MTGPKVRGRYLLLPGAFAAAVALGAGGWYWFRPRTIDVCVISDYSFRQQRTNWQDLLATRFRDVNRVFSGTGVRWHFFAADEPDPTGKLHDVEIRRRRLAHAACKADVIVAVTGQPEGDEAGDVPPFAHTAILVDSPKQPEARNVQEFAQGMAALFGVRAEGSTLGTRTGN
jgi:hypothetical protein